jgi:hypothetical protein
VLEKQYNHHLCLRLTATPAEVAELMAKMPKTVRADLAKDLDGTGEAEKYDLGTQTAYAFRKVQTGLACWSWCDVRSYGEAGRLLAAVVDLSAPLNPLIACQLIRRRLAGRPCCMLSTCRGTLRSGSRPSVPTEAQDGVSSSVCARIRTQSSRSPFRSRATRSRNQTRRQRVPGAGACKAPDGPTGLPQQKTLA